MKFDLYSVRGEKVKFEATADAEEWLIGLVKRKLIPREGHGTFAIVSSDADEMWLKARDFEELRTLLNHIAKNVVDGKRKPDGGLNDP